LPLFVQHVESVRRAPESEKKVTVIDNALHIAIMSARGGCTSKAADKEFGPFVEFDGTFDSVKPRKPDDNNLRAEHEVVLTFDKTTPGTIIHVWPARSALSAWQGVTKGTAVRFRAELNCFVAVQLGTGGGYALTLRDATLVK
jgi:hypothetical protein